MVPAWRVALPAQRRFILTVVAAEDGGLEQILVQRCDVSVELHRKPPRVRGLRQVQRGHLHGYLTLAVDLRWQRFALYGARRHFDAKGGRKRDSRSRRDEDETNAKASSNHAGAPSYSVGDGPSPVTDIGDARHVSRQSNPEQLDLVLTDQTDQAGCAKRREKVYEVMGATGDHGGT